MTKTLDLVFLWHMHQPDYRDNASGEFMLPWVYLHAIKDYTDMAYHLEQHPKMKAVVNFVPILLDQIEDYVQQFSSGDLRDPLLRLLARENLDTLSRAERSLILQSCFRGDRQRMVEPYPAYNRLFVLYERLDQEGDVVLDYLSGQFLADLLVWYHLAWCGESVRREHEQIIYLMSKGAGFDYADRKGLFDLIGKLISAILPRYRALSQRGQVELSATPHYHPLAPLLLDLRSAHESQPDCPLPDSPRYPSGRARVTAQLTAAIETHRARFGTAPAGIWPAEGAISTEFLEVLAEQGCRWTASGEGVLYNTLHASADTDLDRSHYLYRPYRLNSTPNLHCFFRDDRLSDLIGFEYARWYGRDAALHFAEQLNQIAVAAPEGETPVVSIILDGENAWEYYPYNGFYFLDDLYTTLINHPEIQPATYREYLVQRETKSDKIAEASIPRVVAGSWVYGTFSTWIGSPEKNRAWDLLCVAKQSYNLVMASGNLSPEEQQAAEAQLSACEGSDWFWWLGDYNPFSSVEQFDALYRHNLKRLYQLLKLQVPISLDTPISRGSHQAQQSGTMRRAN